MWLIAIFSELIFGAILYGIVGPTLMEGVSYLIFTSIINLFIYLYGYTFILSKTNAEDLISNKSLSRIRNISFKLNVHNPQVFQLSDYPFDLMILITSSKRVIIAIGKELLEALTSSEIDNLLSHSLLINRSSIRYFQFLIIKTEILFFLLSPLRLFHWTNTIWISLRILVNSKIESSIMGKFKQQLAIDNQDILVKLARKKRQKQYNGEMNAVSLYMSLSLTEIRHEELMPSIT